MLHELGHHRCLRRARTNGVDTNARRSVFERSGLCQADNTVLGRGVSGETGNADEAALRGAIDNNAAAPLAHLPQLVLHAIENATQIDLNDAVEITALDVGRMRLDDVNAGCVES